jgi:tyramine---L-glutamate ligase
MRIFVYESTCASPTSAQAAPSLLREGWAMLAAVVEDFQRLPDVKVATLVDRHFPYSPGDTCTRASCRSHSALFHDLASTSGYTLVIAPEFDSLLERQSQMVLDVGGRLLGSLPSATRQTADKLATAARWQALGIAHPRTERFEPDAPVSFDFPWVIKPQWGAGSQATFLIRDEQQRVGIWPTAQSEWPHGNFIVQQYVPGTAASVALLLGSKHIIPLVPARQHISKDGRFRYEGGSLPLLPSLAERAVRLAVQAVAGISGLQGYVGVDVVLGHEDFAIEINPRLTTSYIGLRRLCRLNLAELILRCIQGEPVVTPSWFTEEVQFTVVN